MSYRLGDRCGRLLLRDSLGKGGMAEVFLAEDPKTGGRYAVKTVLPVRDPELLLRFRREAQAQASVDAHPNVLKIHSWHDDPRGSYVVMEYAAGGDLTDCLRQRGRLSPEAAAGLVRDLANGLEHVHGAGVLHRDLKPANVLFDERGTAKLADFGLARIADAKSLTATGAVLGTPSYMSPEQAEGRPVDARSDVYGLGAILYECLCGVPPFTGASVLGILAAVVERAPRRPRDYSAQIPVALEKLCLRCLAKDPSERFQSAGALAVAIESALQEGPSSGSSLRLAAWGLAGCAALAVAVSLSWGSDRPTAVSPLTPDPDVAAGPVEKVPTLLVEGVRGRTATQPRTLRYSARFERLVDPALSEEELQRLQTWRAILFGGSWRELGKALEARFSQRKTSLLKPNHRLSIAAFLMGWKNGSASCLSAFARRLLARPIEGQPLATQAVGLELTWRAALSGDHRSMLRIAKLYGGFGDEAALWGDLVAQDMRSFAGALYLAEAMGARSGEVREVQAGWKTEPPHSIREAERWLADAKRPAPWEEVSDPFGGNGVPAAPSARERVLVFLQERAPLSRAEIAAAVLPTADWSSDFQNLKVARKHGDRSWYNLGKDFDRPESAAAVRESDRERALYCYLQAIVEGDGGLKALCRLGTAVREGAGGAEPNQAFYESILFRAAAIGDGDSRFVAVNLSIPSKDPNDTLRYLNAWAYVQHKESQLVKGAGAMVPADREQAWEWIQKGFGARLAKAKPYSVFQQKPIDVERLWEALVRPPLTDEERSDLIRDCGPYPYDFARRLDKRDMGREPPRGRGPDRRLANAAYLLARQRGVWVSGGKLGKLLVWRRPNSKRDARTLGLDLLIETALLGDRASCEILARLYRQNDPDARWYGLVAKDLRAVGGWAYLSVLSVKDEDRSKLEGKFGARLPADSSQALRFVSESLAKRQRERAAEDR